MSAIMTILKACAISGGGALGALAVPVCQGWGLPEGVGTVYATTHDLLFHWPAHRVGPGDVRADTATYQWMSSAVLATIAHPYAFIVGANRAFCQLIGKVEPLRLERRTIEYIRLVLEYKPRVYTPLSDPMIEFRTWTPHSQQSISNYLRKAIVVPSFS